MSCFNGASPRKTRKKGDVLTLLKVLEKALGNDDINTFEKQKMFEKVWKELDTQIFRVCDEHGENVCAAMIRWVAGGHWLYVDEADGWKIIPHDEVEKLPLLEVEPIDRISRLRRDGRV